MIDLSQFLLHPISNSKAVFQSLQNQINSIVPGDWINLIDQSGGSGNSTNTIPFALVGASAGSLTCQRFIPRRRFRLDISKIQVVTPSAGKSYYCGIYSFSQNLLQELKFSVASAGIVTVDISSAPFTFDPQTMYIIAVGGDEDASVSATGKGNGNLFDNSAMNYMGFTAVNKISGGHLPSTLGGKSDVYWQSMPNVIGLTNPVV